jgi:hypothetical protein
MARRTRLVAQLRELEDVLAGSLEEGGGERREQRLYHEVWDVLTQGAAFDEVLECSRRAAQLAGWIERHLERDRDHAIGKALLEHREFGASAKAVCAFWQVRKSEWDYLCELARYVGERVKRSGHGRPWPPEWLAEVEGYHEQMDVFVSDQALEDTLLGAWEAYFVPVPGKPGSRRREVYGVCFGSVKEEKRTERREGKQRALSIHIRRVALQLRARAGRSYIVPNRRSEEEHLRMARELFPHLELVGDFHSHPYASLDDLRGSRGWEYTPDDEEVNRAWSARLRELGYRPRVGMVLALAEGERSARPARSRQPNIVRVTFGRCQGYLAAYRIRPDGDYDKQGITLQRPAISTLGA